MTETPAKPLRQLGRFPAVPALAGARVLVVDDMAVVATATARILEAFGCQTTVSRSHADATRCLREGTWDLVLADIHLGDGDGRTLLADARAGGAAVIVSSGLPPDAAPVGVRYLVKPWSVDLLLSTVEEALAGR